MSAKIHLYTGNYPIRWADMDMYGHVNHTLYLQYMVEVRWNWFRSLKFNKEINPIFIIIGTSITYKKPLFYPGEAMIKVYGLPPQKKTWSTYHEIFQADNPDVLCAEATVEFIYVDAETKRPASIPDEFRQYLYPQENDEALI